LRNAAHLGEISGSQEVEKKAEVEVNSETPGEVMRCDAKERARGAHEALGAMAMSPLPSETRERERQSEWGVLGECGGGVASMTASMA